MIKYLKNLIKELNRCYFSKYEMFTLGAKHETVVTANPVKIYKSKIDYLNDMEPEETRPKRKSYGSFISPGPYQKPLSIAIPPLTTGTLSLKVMVLSNNVKSFYNIGTFSFL